MQARLKIPSGRTTVTVPMGEARIAPCSYCGKEQLVIHIVRNSGNELEAPACRPCSRNGLTWLISSFPGAFFQRHFAAK